MGKQFFFIIFLIALIVPFVSAVECTPQWSCTDFSLCKDGFETRVCIDLNECPDAVFPEISRGCVGDFIDEEGCESDWKCTEWSSCNVEGSRHRLCDDFQRCDTEESRPLEDQVCTEEGLREVSVFLLIFFLMLLLVLLLSIWYLRNLKRKLREEERTFFIPEHSPGHNKKQA